MKPLKIAEVAIIVAHPDDEILWAGGTILMNPSWHLHVICLCRKSDKERSGRFFQVLKILKSEGVMGDLNDGPEQFALPEADVEQAILDLLPPLSFDLIITHNPNGEYTKHVRHEEISKAVIRLWETGKISTHRLWTFAYEDGHKKYYPQAISNASYYHTLPKQIWLAKHRLIHHTYGFKINSWEEETTPTAEAFWQFNTIHEAHDWLKECGSISIIRA